MPPSIILASKSPFRAQILDNAGVAFRSEGAGIDERAVDAMLEESGAAPDDIALVLAEAKANAVSERFRDSIVIGCDQTLSLGDRVLHKCATMDEARQRLLALAGKTHHLNSAVVVSVNGEASWRHVEICRMTMRAMDAGFIGRHLGTAGDKVLQSVGCYQYEGEGIQLFDRIEGDYFAIVGLPLIPLLHELRRMGAIDG